MPLMSLDWDVYSRVSFLERVRGRGGGSFFWIWWRAAVRVWIWVVELEEEAGGGGLLGFEKQSFRMMKGKQRKKRRASRVSFMAEDCVQIRLDMEVE